MTVQTGNKNSIRDGLDTLCVASWLKKKNVAAFCQYPENLSEAELQKMFYFVWHQRCQDRRAFRLCHGYCFLLSSKFTVKKSKK